MTDKQVAATILQQLGGKRFMFMTGIKDFFTNGDDLCMKLGRNASKANQLQIKYDYGTDLYIMRFFRFTPPRYISKTGKLTEEKIIEIKTFEDVFFDQLEELFREVTGLETRFPKIRRTMYHE